jgi:hypothetical protein
VRIVGLVRFGLTPTRLKRLGDRLVHISVQQRGLTAKTLRPFRPAERRARLGVCLRRGLKSLIARWPDAKFTARGNGKHPWTLDAVVPARIVERLAGTPGMEFVFVNSVRGLRAKQSARVRRWFCVWCCMAIQIEGRRRGMISVEDRLVLVEARSAKEAEAGVVRQFRRTHEEAPYLNGAGYFVRWKLTGIEDTYELLDKEIDPGGTEVYSRMGARRMRAADRWDGD